MRSDDLPLLGLFNRLREHGLPLGIEEYLDVLRAIQAGFGLDDRLALRQLCCTLWAKTSEDVTLLNRLLEQLLTNRPGAIDEPKLPELLSSSSDELSTEPFDEFSRAAFSGGSSKLSSPAVMELNSDEPAQVVQAILKGGYTDYTPARSRSGPLIEYFPVTRRQMKQSWRYLRRSLREGPAEELDVAATVDRIGRQGIMLEPVLVPRRINRAELVLLIDQDGSMAPFHELTRQMVNTAYRGGRLRKAGVYYFHDCPATYLYTEPARVHAVSIAGMLASIGERAAVLIISDAGAARGNLDMDRVRWSERLLADIKQAVRHFAWLNPMPRTRWSGTTAAKIAGCVPMFDMSRQGLQAAINALRGLYTYSEEMTP